MIVSVSRRTDIPAFYSEWFFERIKEGYVLVRNPMNYHRISRISLSPEVVDCFVFITKNPEKMLPKMHLLKNYNYYFQFTLNPYDKSIERNLPDKKKIINTFKALSDMIGPERVIWRYDPIILNRTITTGRQIEYFEKFARSLSGYTNKCIISFIDLYKSTLRNSQKLKLREITTEEMYGIAKAFSEIAANENIKIETCAEKVDLSCFGIEPGSCIDAGMVEKIAGKPIRLNKDKYQRNECGCAESIDIGTYDTCLHNCVYCYAVKNYKTAVRHYAEHDPKSPVLFGRINPQDVITERKMQSNFLSCLEYEQTSFI